MFKPKNSEQMSPSEAIREVLYKARVTQVEMAEMMGYKSQSGFSGRLSGKISCDLLIEMLEKLDYEVVIQPKTQGKRKEGSIVLEPSGLPDGRKKKGTPE